MLLSMEPFVLNALFYVWNDTWHHMLVVVSWDYLSVDPSLKDISRSNLDFEFQVWDVQLLKIEMFCFMQSLAGYVIPP